MNEFNLLAIFLAGVVTFFTPCVLPLIPVYISTITGNTLEELKEHKRAKIKAFILGLFFMLGFTLAFMLLGFSASALGQVFHFHKDFLMRVGGY